MKDVLKYGALAVGLGIAGIAAVSFVNIVTAPMRAGAGVISRTLDADNIIATYEGFHDRWKGYEARIMQIRSTRTLMANETDQGELRRFRVELAAQAQSCRDIAARYNSDAAKTNRVIFQGREAPATLDMEACNQ